MKIMLSATRIVMVYMLFALAWIFFSDQVVQFFIKDAVLISQIQTLKGMLFVVVTGLLLFVLIRQKLRDVEAVQKKLKMHEQRLEYVIQGANLGYWDWNYETHEHWVNDRWLSFLGLKRSDIKDKSTDWIERIHPMDRPIAEHAIEQTIKDHLPYVIEFRMRHKDGHWVWIEGSGAVVEWDEKTHLPLRLSGTHRDISERKHLQEEMRFLALNDPLTALPNRIYLRQELERLLLSTRELAFMFLDLDAFKNINDMFGHSIGDKVIQDVAKRFSRCLREADFLARVGGDEFVIISSQKSRIEHLAQLLVSSLDDPVMIENEAFNIGVSMGIALSPQDGFTFEILFKNADTAMYEAKKSGKNSYVFYTPAMTEAISSQIVMDHDLQHAIENDEFSIYFQPQIHFATEKTVGLEALVRWQHPQKGLIPPLSFIPRAEENRLIIPLGELIFQKTVQQMRRWQESGLFHGTVAINISSVQLDEETFVDKIEAIRQSNQVEASLIELEITESCLMSHPETSAKTLQKLENLGYRISVDDFGTGFSSLSYLKQLPIHKLKIDRSFIKDLPHDKDDRAISKAIIALAQALELEVLAEGVETQAQKTFLIENGCDSAQGYFWEKPLSALELEHYLRQN
jgi:diguanylate cyclase (GGDEF)-like protein/PAS domain S-box-containing protein